MKKAVQYQVVPLKDIDLANDRYTLSPFAPKADPQLRASIAELGLLRPPLLVADKNKKFIVLSGRKCLKILSELEPDSTVTALVLCQPDNQLLLCKTLLQHQLGGAPLSLIEQAGFCQLASKYLAPAEVVSLLPLMGLKAKPHLPAQLIALLALEERVQEGVHLGIISQRAARKLAQFSPSDQHTLAGVISTFQLGGSKQQQLIDRVFELTRRMQLTAAELLSQWLEEGDGEKELNRPQQAAAMLNRLQQECQPRLAAEQDSFRAYCNRLALPPAMRVSHTPSFENEAVSLEIEFPDREQLADLLPQLESLLAEQGS